MKRSTKLIACAAVVSGSLAFYGCGKSQTSTTAQENPGSAASPSGSANRTNPSGTLSSNDADFIRKAAKGGLAEVELGRLAQQKAASDVVKRFGQRMEQDHSKANQELQQLASSKGATVPQSLDDKDAAERDRLSKLSGGEFDAAYMREMVKDHLEDVSEFQRETNNGQDLDVKAFASKMLPILQDHLRMA
ncbi:MAG: outer membrane protein, partial [Bryobacterales bacterium]|nr:outer membrane protein [Bryobacterales bacterium]